MSSFETMSYNEQVDVEGGAVLLATAVVIGKATLVKLAPVAIKAGIGIAGSVVAQKVLDKIFN